MLGGRAAGRPGVEMPGAMLPERQWGARAWRGRRWLDLHLERRDPPRDT